MIKIVFATVTGNSEATANFLKQFLTDNGSMEVELVRAENMEAEHFVKEDTYIVVGSTWNLGEMNQFIIHIYQDLEKVDLNGVNMAFVGLGDRIYGEEHFCRSIIDFREKALTRGANELLDPLYIDGEPEPQFEGVVKEWAQTLLSKISV